MDHFQKTWSDFDPDARGFIKKEDLGELLFGLDKPLGWDESVKIKPRV